MAPPRAQKALNKGKKGRTGRVNKQASGKPRVVSQKARKAPASAGGGGGGSGGGSGSGFTAIPPTPGKALPRAKGEPRLGSERHVLREGSRGSSIAAANGQSKATAAKAAAATTAAPIGKRRSDAGLIVRSGRIAAAAMHIEQRAPV